MARSRKKPSTRSNSSAKQTVVNKIPLKRRNALYLQTLQDALSRNIGEHKSRKNKHNISLKMVDEFTRLSVEANRKIQILAKRNPLLRGKEYLANFTNITSRTVLTKMINQLRKVVSPGYSTQYTNYIRSSMIKNLGYIYGKVSSELKQLIRTASASKLANFFEKNPELKNLQWDYGAPFAQVAKTIGFLETSEQDIIGMLKAA